MDEYKTQNCVEECRHWEFIRQQATMSQQSLKRIICDSDRSNFQYVNKCGVSLLAESSFPCIQHAREKRTLRWVESACVEYAQRFLSDQIMTEGFYHMIK